MIDFSRFRVFIVWGTWIASLAATANAAEPARVPAAQLLSHFPDRAHAVVWRNWHAVEPVRIAQVLGTSVDTIHSMAESMGLPPAVPIPQEQKTRGYFFMTVCRRNSTCRWIWSKRSSVAG